MQACNYDKRTALHLAACEGHSDCVKFLVEKCKISPLVKDRYVLYTTMQCIYKTKHYSFIQIAYQVDIITFLILLLPIFRWGFTPLEEAKRFQHDLMFRYLAKYAEDNYPSELEDLLKEQEKLKKANEESQKP